MWTSKRWPEGEPVVGADAVDYMRARHDTPAGRRGGRGSWGKRKRMRWRGLPVGREPVGGTRSRCVPPRRTRSSA
jgi:hypothetical protein